VWGKGDLKVNIIDIMGIIIVSVFIGAIIDYVLFLIWHNSAHSKEFKKLEKKSKRNYGEIKEK